MKRIIVLSLIALALFSSCSKKKTIDHLQLLDDKLTFTLDISPDREDPKRINGKLRVVNSSIDMVKYGNFQLFLDAEGKRAETRVKTNKADAMADRRLLHLSPDDSLKFIAHWDFDEPIDFYSQEFSLVYDASITPPAPPVLPRSAPADTAAEEATETAE